ncbi:MAG: 5,6-dimethylbenzimidazole synthase [Filomicrobium sp.]
MAEIPTFDAAFQDQLEALFVWRRDVRRFKTEPVPPNLIEDLLRIANLSPSVGNSQPWRWVEVTTPERRQLIQKNFKAANEEAAANYDDASTRAHYLSLKLAGLKESPVQFAVFCDVATSQGRGLGAQTMPETLAYSTVASIQTFWLAARAKGLGLGWVSIIDADTVKRGLDVPESWQLIAYLCVGWPEEEHSDPELVRAGWQSRTAMQIIRR